MRHDAGFTLLELVVALVVTSLVALLAYGTVSAGYATSDRLERYRSTVEARMIARALLVDALRHLPQGGGAAMNDVLFTLEDRTDAGGLPRDGVGFLSRGLVPPLGVSGSWWVTLAATDAGVRLLAAPLSGEEGATLDVVLPEARGLDVRVLARSDDARWSDFWNAPGRVPAAVALELLSADGRRVAPPLVVRAALEGLP